jgi:hypothetical protein
MFRRQDACQAFQHRRLNPRVFGPLDREPQDITLVIGVSVTRFESAEFGNVAIREPGFLPVEDVVMLANMTPG